LPEGSPADREAVAFTTRPVEAADEAFLERLYGTTRTQELALLDWPEEQKRQFVRQQFEAQRTHYHANFPDADHRIVLQDGEAIGQTWVDRREDELRLLDMALLPEHRDAGIGTAILRQLQAEAQAAGQPMTLFVELNNPGAKRLYLRLGFAVVEDHQTHQFMEWVPPKGV
jgi:ribosomal protein S18 acetylase RimI-like enzyme